MVDHYEPSKLYLDLHLRQTTRQRRWGCSQPPTLKKKITKEKTKNQKEKPLKVGPVTEKDNLSTPIIEKSKKEKENEPNCSMAANEVSGVAAGESQSVWRPPSKCIMNVVEFMERAKQCTHLITDGRLMVDLDAQERIAKKKVSVFLLDKLTRKICRCTKSTVLKTLYFLGVKPQQIIKRLFFSFGTYCCLRQMTVRM